MRTRRIISLWVLLLCFTCAWACAQDSPPRVEVFAEGGSSSLSNGAVGGYCNALGGCIQYGSFSNGGRLFTGARFRFTPHDAIEASYSYSPNPIPNPVYSDRFDLFSFNYVRYLAIRPGVQPFVTAGVGANRFSGLPNLVIPPGNFHFAGNFGGGTDLIVQRHVALRLELRDYVGGQPSYLPGTSHTIVPSAGIVFRFK